MTWLQGELLELIETLPFDYHLLQTYALATLYYTWNFDVYPPWLRGVHPCVWIYLVCEEDGTITSLDMAGIGLGGSIPAE